MSMSGEAHCASALGGATNEKSLYLIIGCMDLYKIWIVQSRLMTQSIKIGNDWLKGLGLLQQIRFVVEEVFRSFKFQTSKQNKKKIHLCVLQS